MKARSAEELLKEIEALKDWIRDEGDRTDTCTYNILREVCDGCRCNRKQVKPTPSNEG